MEVLKAKRKREIRDLEKQKKQLDKYSSRDYLSKEMFNDIDDMLLKTRKEAVSGSNPLQYDSKYSSEHKILEEETSKSEENFAHKLDVSPVQNQNTPNKNRQFRLKQEDDFGSEFMKLREQSTSFNNPRQSRRSPIVHESSREGSLEKDANGHNLGVSQNSQIGGGLDRSQKLPQMSMSEFNLKDEVLKSVEQQEEEYETPELKFDESFTNKLMEELNPPPSSEDPFKLPEPSSNFSQYDSHHRQPGYDSSYKPRYLKQNKYRGQYDLRDLEGNLISSSRQASDSQPSFKEDSEPLNHKGSKLKPKKDPKSKLSQKRKRMKFKKGKKKSKLKKNKIKPAGEKKQKKDKISANDKVDSQLEELNLTSSLETNDNPVPETPPHTEVNYDSLARNKKLFSSKNGSQHNTEPPSKFEPHEQKIQKVYGDAGLKNYQSRTGKTLSESNGENGNQMIPEEINRKAQEIKGSNREKPKIGEQKRVSDSDSALKSSKSRKTRGKANPLSSILDHVVKKEEEKRQIEGQPPESEQAEDKSVGESHLKENKKNDGQNTTQGEEKLGESINKEPKKTEVQTTPEPVNTTEPSPSKKPENIPKPDQPEKSKDKNQLNKNTLGIPPERLSRRRISLEDALKYGYAPEIDDVPISSEEKQPVEKPASIQPEAIKITIPQPPSQSSVEKIKLDEKEGKSEPKIE